ncbi:MULTISPECIES: helix-turn-helix domain-containing protein [unclassified Sulfitobacter]|uniref:helix-turn-helix domain-containing protein n=1 Tax=unclassified Sulfitobacter TaxID=196795 RepID=UPI0023E11EA6|nr:MULTISPECIES: helix-turn-helix domain-containing protein [unclassified Sulfitobacter]MDF3384599.1 helix-turn-helix domain-containing protein [Sulfitobacter sp. Ks11]MDF3388087.1 helix-turn-helix domain-containing protein [Sulfitobacter sp. M85]MDF3391508.1 helix-turn-helix domain-containing protein [Sulfitobacter sp. Ks16]MDF3402074.1 helix-turn-helix domain-containing protein [Sulfitobacter sp. KE39]MDF3405566.1 helix-turn-helix domain-containing protein [Sulfitobacter sp. Ks35]
MTRRRFIKFAPSDLEQPKVLLTVQEVAQLDCCSEKTVRRAIASGQLRALRVGPGSRLIRIDPDDHVTYRNTCFA